MRRELLNPIIDKDQLQAAVKLARNLYRLHEAGQDYAKPLVQLAKLVGKPIIKSDVDAAFGSVRPEMFARQLTYDPTAIPKDLTETEMLELVKRVCEADGNEFQIQYWVKCLEANTGDKRISALIYWPETYFEDGENGGEFSPREILDTALAAGKKSHSKRKPKILKRNYDNPRRHGDAGDAS